MNAVFKKLEQISFVLFATVVTLLFPLLATAAELISDVRVVAQSINFKNRSAATITWQMGENAEVILFICDLDGVIVRRLLEKRLFPAGAASADWDGRGEDGAPCPDGAYVPIIRVKTKRSYQVYNPTMHPWGESFQAEDIRYDAERKELSYRLSKSAICLIRIGEIKGGPLYNTLLQWKPRPAGEHKEFWDGKDAQGLVDVSTKPKIKIMIDAIALPENAIMITGSSRIQPFKRIQAERIFMHPASGHVFMHSLHERQFCRDIDIAVSVKSKSWFRKNPPVISGITDVQVDIPDRDHLAYLVREGMEIYAFMDGAFITEIKVKSFPAGIEFKTDPFTAGEHVLTINVRSTEDHMGTHSLAVRVSK